MVAGTQITLTGRGPMRLPNAEKAIIERRKLTEYLLSETHPTGRFKAQFFKKLGFEQANVEKFEEWLRSIALNESVTEVVSSPYGVKYIVDAQITIPSAERVRVRTVWIVEWNDDRPRFVTAYPISRISGKEGR
jgi:hypothetical protein